jgi:hypothetical protein
MLTGLLLLPATGVQQHLPHSMLALAKAVSLTVINYMLLCNFLLAGWHL